jgi:hypothetical protein
VVDCATNKYRGREAPIEIITPGGRETVNTRTVRIPPSAKKFRYLECSIRGKSVTGERTPIFMNNIEKTFGKHEIIGIN